MIAVRIATTEAVRVESLPILRSRYFYGFKNLFDYGATRWFDLNVPNQHFEANFDVYLSEWSKIHKALKAGNSQNKTPLAGAVTNEAFKQLKINGQRVDEVKEYVEIEI